MNYTRWKSIYAQSISFVIKCTLHIYTYIYIYICVSFSQSFSISLSFYFSLLLFLSLELPNFDWNKCVHDHVSSNTITKGNTCCQFCIVHVTYANQLTWKGNPKESYKLTNQWRHYEILERIRLWQHVAYWRFRVRVLNQLILYVFYVVVERCFLSMSTVI